MADTKGPWERLAPPPTPPSEQPPPDQPRPGSRRRLAALAILALAIPAIWTLSQAFPGRLSLKDDWSNLGWGLGSLALVGAGLASRRIPLHEALRYILIWGALAVVLMLGYAYRGEGAEAWNRIRSGLNPAYPVAGASHEMTLSQDADGQYYAVGEVDGQKVTFMVDTGASDIVLSPDDARRIGVDLSAQHFDTPYETANGEGFGARYVVHSLAFGDFHLADVPVSINRAPMRTSLLGMAFLKRLDSYAFEDRRLKLKWR